MTAMPHTPAAFSFRAWLRHEWPAAVFVTAAVMIAHHYEWLDPIDGHAFVVIGNLSADLRAERREGDLRMLSLARALAVEIDQAGFESSYQGRSPLDRCRLRDDVCRLYRQKPAVLVIDLDLSPALWLMGHGGRPAAGAEIEPQLRCQEALYQLIKTQAATVPTVLMSPFGLSDQTASQTKNRWKHEMEASGVRFGSGDIPVHFGLALRSEVGPDSLVGNAYAALGLPRDAASGRDTSLLVDPRKYRLRDGVGVTSLRELEATNGWHILGGRIVFFGAGYGSDGDVFLTPGGEFYGVEFHLAALLSRLEPLVVHHVLDVVVDLAFALAFGLVLAFMRSAHERLHASGGPSGRELAGALVLVFGLALVVMAGIAAWLSFYLLRQGGIWSSPVPVMIGMLIHSAIPAAWNEPSHHAVQSSEPRRVAWLVGGLVFAFGDPRKVDGRGHRLAAIWMAVRSVLWWAVVIYAFYSIVHP